MIVDRHLAAIGSVPLIFTRSLHLHSLARGVNGFKTHEGMGNLFKSYDMHEETLNLSAPQSAAVEQGVRVLSFIGLSSTGLATVLATPACDTPHLGGSHDASTRRLCRGLLSTMLASSGLQAFKLRLDPHVRLLVGNNCEAQQVSKGIEVELPLDAAKWVAVSALQAVCIAKEACKSAKTIWSEMGLTTTKVEAVCCVFC